MGIGKAIVFDFIAGTFKRDKSRLYQKNEQSYYG